MMCGKRWTKYPGKAIGIGLAGSDRLMRRSPLQRCLMPCMYVERYIKGRLVLMLKAFYSTRPNAVVLQSNIGLSAELARPRSSALRVLSGRVPPVHV